MTQWLKRRTRPVRKSTTARLSHSLGVHQMTAICALPSFATLSSQVEIPATPTYGTGLWNAL
jgi:hypothetical protein